MNLRAALLAARGRLEAAGIEEARLEAEVLLRHVLGLDRAGLFRRLQEPLAPEALPQLEALIERRLAHEPLAYITGQREFFGLDLLVNRHTLIPRPETELLVEAALQRLRSSASRQTPIVADVGTGCGAVVIALARVFPGACYYAIDVSGLALHMAALNARRHGVAARIVFRRGDLLSPLDRFVDLIAANLPYVKSTDLPQLQPEVRDYEPPWALDGGPDGLTAIRRLLRLAPAYLRPGGAVCLEFGDREEEGLRQAAAASFPSGRTEILADLAGLPRVAVIEAPGAGRPIRARE